MLKTEKRLTAKEVCLIIIQCKDAGLSELAWGDLKLTFHGEAQQMPPEIHVSPAIAERQNQIEQSAFIEEQVEDREEMLQRLKIEDPVAFEKLQLSGELELTPRGVADGEEERFS